MDIDLRKYLQQYHNQLTWKERIRITFEITNALNSIHFEKAIHRDLHSGNILYSQYNDCWCISDLGFCGPANKSSTSIYGNLPYIAPEVIDGREYTYASDIYSIAMLMWEISSGQPPFINYEHDYDLAINIINGVRPKIVSETPLEYKNLMKKCWDADPLKRPDISTLIKIIRKINLYYQSMPDELFQQEIDNLEANYTSKRLFISKVHNFENLLESRNSTEASHSKSYDFNIPNNIDDFHKSNERNSVKSSKIINTFRGDSERLPNEFKMLQINSNIKGKNIDINDDEKELILRKTKRQNI
ncbi:kinase-like protein, partial [Rhizophagus irregularis]